jgi:long-chain fatty acid transport protein
MSKTRVLRNTAIALAVAGTLPAALATNGMVLEGYGPISASMGGASQAFDHGTAAMAQNPATLSMMEDGSRLDIAVGLLGPKITASMTGMPSADSGGTAYMMPAVGYARKSGAYTYGIGVYAVGGMGTEYGSNSFLAMGSGQDVRSELGVGSLILPLSYQVNDRLAIGGSVDFVWASLDLKMAASGSQLGGLVTASSGALGGALPALAGASWARVDFSDDSKYTGAAKSNGYRGKLGVTYKVDEKLTVGGSYQTKTSLRDMETGAGAASLTAQGGFADAGKITVVNFQWPSITSIGASWQASPALMLAADLKSIGWADVMKNFTMRYDSAGMGGSVSFALPQNWKDQTVVSIGGAYKVNNQLTLRAGLNIADNPIPEDKVNPLFPATIKSHYTLGAGYAFDKVSSVNFSYVMAPEVSTTDANGITVKHSQSNWQLMYSHRF